MSSDTTSINQLPSQNLSQQPLNNTQNNAQNNMIPNSVNSNQNINMVIQESSMNHSSMNSEKRLTADEMNDKIRTMNSTIETQPSQIPQSTMPQQPQLQQPQQLQPQQNNFVQQNEMGHLLNSLNNINNQQTSATKLPIHQIQNQPTNIDPTTQINHLNNTIDQGYLTQRLREQHQYLNDDFNNNNNNNNENNNGNLQKRQSFYQHWFNELKIPLLICCLFFIFQLPFYRQNLHKNFKFLFQSDGNMNLYGYLTSSILFSIGYYMLNKFV